MKSTLEGIKVDGIEEWISKLEDRVVKITQAKKRKKTNEDSLKDLSDNIKHTNIHIVGVPEAKVGKKRHRTYFKI